MEILDQMTEKSDFERPEESWIMWGNAFQEEEMASTKASGNRMGPACVRNARS